MGGERESMVGTPSKVRKFSWVDTDVQKAISMTQRPLWSVPEGDLPPTLHDPLASLFWKQ